MVLVLGNLRYSIQVISKSVTKDEFGAEIVTWTNSFKLRAERKFAAGDKTLDNKEVFNSQRLVLTTFFRRGVSTDDRIIFQDKKYLIKSIVEIGFGEGMQIDCELIND